MKTTTIVRSVLFTAICLLASKLPAGAQNLFALPVPNSSFLTLGAGVPADNNHYANQFPTDYNPYGVGQYFAGWENSAYNYQLYQISGGVQTTNYTTFTTLNPVGTVINNATYTLTVALQGPIANYGSVVLSLFTGTQEVDPTDYSAIPPYYLQPSTGLPYPTNPNPIFAPGSITTFATGGPSDASTIPATWTDYTATFNTLDGANASFIGKSLFVGIQVNNPSTSTDFGNVRVSELALVPEPSTWALMLAGVVGLIAIGRRKLKA
jgi:hypothetical protein